MGRKRGSGMGGVMMNASKTLNQILVEMDGFDGETNVIVLAATNARMFWIRLCFALDDLTDV